MVFHAKHASSDFIRRKSPRKITPNICYPGIKGTKRGKVRYARRRESEGKLPFISILRRHAANPRYIRKIDGKGERRENGSLQTHPKRLAWVVSRVRRRAHTTTGTHSRRYVVYAHPVEAATESPRDSSSRRRRTRHVEGTHCNEGFPRGEQLQMFVRSKLGSFSPGFTSSSSRLSRTVYGDECLSSGGNFDETYYRRCKFTTANMHARSLDVVTSRLGDYPGNYLRR